jgi:hypothetical protein
MTRQGLLMIRSERHFPYRKCYNENHRYALEGSAARPGTLGLPACNQEHIDSMQNILKQDNICQGHLHMMPTLGLPACDQEHIDSMQHNLK